jgi:hypothetical protein
MDAGAKPDMTGDAAGDVELIGTFPAGLIAIGGS